MFSTPEAAELRDHYDARDYVFDQCQYGLVKHPKPTQLLTNAEMQNMSNRCTQQNGYHEAMRGRSGEAFRTKKHSAYPSQLCHALAAA